MKKRFSQTRRWGVALALASLLLLMAGCGGAQQPGTAQPQPAATEQPQAPDAAKPAQGPTKDSIKPVPGYRAANFTATDVFTGEKVTLADLKGQVVFLNFWATWCPPCKAEMPEMQALHEEMGDKVRIIALGGDSRESAAKMGQFAKSMGLSFTIAHDKGMALEAYLVRGLPTSFFIDANGVIQARHAGPMRLDQMKQYIAEAEKAAATK